MRIPFVVTGGYGVNHHDCLNAPVAAAFTPHPQLLVSPPLMKSGGVWRRCRRRPRTSRPPSSLAREGHLTLMARADQQRGRREMPTRNTNQKRHNNVKSRDNGVLTRLILSTYVSRCFHHQKMLQLLCKLLSKLECSCNLNIIAYLRNGTNTNNI